MTCLSSAKLHRKLSVIRVLDDFDETQQPKSMIVLVRLPFRLHVIIHGLATMADDGIIDALLSNIIFGGHCVITTRYARGSAARICSVARAGGSSVRVETRVRDDRHP